MGFLRRTSHRIRHNADVIIMLVGVNRCIVNANICQSADQI